jgi:uncharacterized repeat protein (TIGR03803 family)
MKDQPNYAEKLAVTRVVGLVLAIMFMFALSGAVAQAQTETTLYSFKGGTDGEVSYASLFRDAKGNLYGTTVGGGASFGTVFSLTPAGKEKVLHSFTSVPDGALPYAALVGDGKGNFYGTTSQGGKSKFGSVFQVTAAGKEKVLYSFTGGKDGSIPFAGLIQDAKGNLYGAALEGGTSGVGTIYRLTLAGKQKVLYTFTGGVDGALPYCILIQDTKGNFYGTTLGGGSIGGGTVFEVTPAGKEKVLYNFSGGADGAQPYGGVIRDAKGNLYGTTSIGGKFGAGTVFRVTPSGKEKVLFNFSGGADGGTPFAALVQDAKGNLYGTTFSGGQFTEGTVFKVTLAGKETVLHSFTAGADGAIPFGGLIIDAKGNLYGTTLEGGAFELGVVFKIVP